MCADTSPTSGLYSIGTAEEIEYLHDPNLPRYEASRLLAWLPLVHRCHLCRYPTCCCQLLYMITDSKNALSFLSNDCTVKRTLLALLAGARLYAARGRRHWWREVVGLRQVRAPCQPAAVRCALPATN